MFFFMAILIVIAIVIINAYSKHDPITQDKIECEVFTSKQMVENGEEFYLIANVKNNDNRPIRRLLVGFSVYEWFVVSGKGFKQNKAISGKKEIICRVSVNANSTYQIRLPLKCYKRGVHSFYKVNACYLDFFGFHSAFYTQELNVNLTVLPKRVSNVFLTDLVSQGFGDLNAKKGYIADETSVRSYTEYTGREPMRHISWKKTAQTDEFTVKQFEPMGTTIVTIVLDVSGSVNMQNGTLQENYVEYSISMLRELFEHFENNKIPYVLYTNAKAHAIKSGIFRSFSNGEKSKETMRFTLGELDLIIRNADVFAGSNALLDYAVKNSHRAPIAYFAPKDRKIVTGKMKRLGKTKGVEIIQVYAENYCKL